MVAYNFLSVALLLFPYLMYYAKYGSYYFFFYVFFLDQTKRHDFWPRLWLFFSSFLFPPEKRGKKKRIMISKNRDQKSCLSARSFFFALLFVSFAFFHFCSLPLFVLLCFYLFHTLPLQNVSYKVYEKNLQK